MSRLPEAVYHMAFAMTRKASVELKERVAERGMSLEEFFVLPAPELVRRLGLNESGVIRMEWRAEALLRAAREHEFARRNNIRVMWYGGEGYPRRLAACCDAPLCLYALGDADLDAEMMVSIVGTRRCTQVGLSFASTMPADFASLTLRPTIISGLAYGIDTAAHRGALDSGLPTVAVMAHGLDTIYPAANRELARRIVRAGGAIVSEYPTGTKPFPPRFLERNRIVAGLADVVMVVESEIKGGAMSTARLASDYSREVAALPGRFNDAMSAGCNYLIRTDRARLVASTMDLLELMNWDSEYATIDHGKSDIFKQLDTPSKAIYNALRESGEALSLDVLQYSVGVSAGELLARLGEMEFDGVVQRIPGNRFMLC